MSAARVFAGDCFAIDFSENQWFADRAGHISHNNIILNLCH
jgi:hypothetical protein